MLQHRPMQATDVAECVEIVAANPILRPRYGDALAGLAKTWLLLLGRYAFTAEVFEEVLEAAPRGWSAPGLAPFCPTRLCAR